MEIAIFEEKFLLFVRPQIQRREKQKTHFINVNTNKEKVQISYYSAAEF